MPAPDSYSEPAVCKRLTDLLKLECLVSVVVRFWLGFHYYTHIFDIAAKRDERINSVRKKLAPQISTFLLGCSWTQSLCWGRGSAFEISLTMANTLLHLSGKQLVRWCLKQGYVSFPEQWQQQPVNRISALVNLLNVLICSSVVGC